MVVIELRMAQKALAKITLNVFLSHIVVMERDGRKRLHWNRAVIA